jgi:hypothetical protein
MSEGYENIIVVEANRQQAFVDDLNTNIDQNAHWINQTGAGIHLDIGDTIQMKSAYVSELGAQAATIEIEGKEFNNGKTAEFTTTTTSDTGTANTTPSLNLGNAQMIFREFNSEKLTDSVVSYKLNDYSINMLVSPYKTANGEYCSMLPRRFINTGLSETDPDNECLHSWDVFDTFAKGNVFFNELKPYSFNKHDSRPMMEPSLTPADYGTKGYTKYNVKNRTDNSRYVIFSSDTVRNVFIVEDLLPSVRDLATCREFKQVKYHIDLEVSKGFNSPSNIAEQLTTQLNQRTPYDKVERPIGWEQELGTETNITATTDTPCYKPYNCAKAGSGFTSAGYTDWDDDQHNINAYHYYDAFQNIGVKRPDLYRLGREVNGSMGFEIGQSGIALSVGASIPNGPPPYIQNKLLLRENSRNDELITSLEWTSDNLEALKNLFVAQESYPELFDYDWWSGETTTDRADTTKMNYQSLENSRFIHMNRFQIWDPAPVDPDVPILANGIAGPPMNPAQFGSDNYNESNGVVGWVPLALPPVRQQSQTAPFFVSYDPNSPYIDELDVVPSPTDFPHKVNFGAGNNVNSLAYGFALKRWSLEISKWVIAFTPEMTLPVGSLCPQHFYQGEVDVAPLVDGSNSYLNGYTTTGGGFPIHYRPRKAGWDHHFNAYGCPCMLITNGQTGQNGTSYGTGKQPESVRIMNGYSSESQEIVANRKNRKYEMEKYMDRIYLGANKPLINFDESQSRFTIENLHTPEYIGNLWNAGSVSKEGSAADPGEESVDENPNANVPCYKINKKLNRTNYNTDMSPYQARNKTMSDIPGTPATFATEISAHNFNIDTQTIFDSMSGLFIEDFGMPEKYWDRSLWGLMGFSYSQFHPTSANKVNRQTRITNGETLNYMEFPTTCQKVVMDDSLEWTRNIFDKPVFNPQPFTYQIPHSSVSADNTAWFANVNPEIVVSGSSVAITAENLPTKTLRPYFTIRSDLIKQRNFVGSQDAGQPLPVVGVVDKMNGQGDFFFQQSSDLIFTNTTKRTITSITTSIHDPDGRLARVDKNSSVLYRINKHVNADLTPVQTLMANKDKQSKITIQNLNKDLSL